MKTKLLYFLFVLGAVTLLGSCEKDGIYNPKEKISKMYSDYTKSDNTVEKQLREDWHWDGNKLESIDYYRPVVAGDNRGDNEFYYTAEFKYKGKRLQEIKQGNYTFNYYYDGKHLSKVEVFHESELSEERVFSYDGNQLIKSITTGSLITRPGPPDSDKIDNNLHKSILDLTIGAHVTFPLYNKKIQEKILTLQNKENTLPYIIICHYDYNGDQLVKIYAEFFLDNNPSSKEEYTFRYDNKKNPFQYDLSAAYFPLNSTWIEENNITHTHRIATTYDYESGEMIDTSISSSIYTYEYNEKDYPTIIDRTDIIEDGDEEWRNYYKDYIEYK